MWFKMSDKLLNGAVARDLLQSRGAGDRYGRDRLFAFIVLLAKTAAGISDLRNATDLQNLTGIGDKQAEIVWGILLKSGVLRVDGDYYTAVEWMMEQGIYGEKKRKAKETTIQAPTPSPTPLAYAYSTDGRSGF
jgi:hypothetical protein